MPLDRGIRRWGVKADSDGRVRALRPANLLRLDVGRPAASAATTAAAAAAAEGGNARPEALP